MQKTFLEEKIKRGFEQEKELLQCEITKKEKISILFYVRPIFFVLMLTISLAALGIRSFGVIKYFIVN